MSNMKYSLDAAHEVLAVPATEEELAAAREAATAAVKKDPSGYAFRSCWNCNTAHAHFLEDLNDGFLMACFGCGHWYYQGIDISEGDEESEE